MSLITTCCRIPESNCEYHFAVELRFPLLPMVKWEFIRDDESDYRRVQNTVTALRRIMKHIDENSAGSEQTNGPWISRLIFEPRTEWTTSKVWIDFTQGPSSLRVGLTGSEEIKQAIESSIEAFVNVSKLFTLVNDVPDAGQQRHQLQHLSPEYLARDEECPTVVEDRHWSTSLLP